MSCFHYIPYLLSSFDALLVKMVDLTEDTKDGTASKVVASKEVKGVGGGCKPGDYHQKADPGEGVHKHVYHAKEASVSHPSYHLDVSRGDRTDGSQQDLTKL